MKLNNVRFRWFVCIGLVESGLIMFEVPFLTRILEKSILQINNRFIDLSYL